MAAAYRIVSVKENQTIDENGRPQKTMRVEWRTTADGPFVLDFPADAFNVDFAREQIQRHADELARLRGI
jgi:hypothetical protein